MSTARQFDLIGVDSVITDGKATYRIKHVMSASSVLAVDMVTDKLTRLQIDAVRLAPPVEGVAADDGQGDDADRDLEAFEPKEIEAARRRLQAIRPLLEMPRRGVKEVAAVAKATGISQASLYRWLRDYERSQCLSALVPGRRGRKPGATRLSEPVELIVQSAIEDLYLKRQRHRPVEVIEAVRARCRLARVEPPHDNTVRKRIAQIHPATRLRRRGKKDEADNRYSPIRGQFPGADTPLAVVQIDHTPLGVEVVDEAFRQTLGRPWITLAIDVYSRMVAGIYLTMEAPSATSVALCLVQAMTPKREYLAGLGITGEWPLWGKPAKIHTDNGKEFRGHVLRRACEEYGIDLNLRPVKKPHYGGHIERLIGTVDWRTHRLPGTTFSNPRDRRGYDSAKESAMTLREVEAHLVDFIVNQYHQRVHSALSMSPLRKWERGLAGDDDNPGTSLIPVPHDPKRLLLDFLPFYERTIQRYGIQIDEITYYDPILDRYIGSTDSEDPKHKRKFIVRRDPRNVSHVYFFDPTDRSYYSIPYRNVTHPAVSEWELREARLTLKAQGRQDVDEVLIFEAIERQRQRVADAVHKTKLARRKAQRNPQTNPPPLRPAADGVSRADAARAQQPATGAPSPGRPPADAPGDDLFGGPVEPFGGITLS